MFAFKVRKMQAEAAKLYLKKTGLLMPHFNARRQGEFVLFPVVKKAKVPLDGAFVHAAFDAVPHTPSFREALVQALGPKRGHEATAAFDTLGSLAIIEVPLALEKKQDAIARALLDSNPRIQTVLKKESSMQGEFRVRKFIWLAGRRTYAVEYHESGCRMRFDVRKTYFSTRLAHERHRIAGLVKPGENVLALFAGVGPFALVMAKQQPLAHVVAVELNPDAFVMMQDNVALNKAANVRTIQGDVRAVLKKFPKWADRACMPLPHTGHDFLADVIAAMKDGGVVHFYGFGGEREGVFTLPLKAVKAACKRQGVRCRLIQKRVVRPYAPAVFQVVIDFQVVRVRRGASASAKRKKHGVSCSAFPAFFWGRKKRDQSVLQWPCVDPFAILSPTIPVAFFSTQRFIPVFNLDCPMLRLWLGFFQWRVRRGQVSAEMLILTAALVAVALLLVTQLQHTADQGNTLLGKQAAEAFKQIGKIS